MRADQVVAWTYDGAIYCPDCAEVDESDPEWSPIFSLEDDHEGMCCGSCGHNLACCHQVPGEMWQACPVC